MFSCQVSVWGYQDICWSKYFKRILFRTLQSSLVSMTSLRILRIRIVYQFYGPSYWTDTSCQCQPPGRCRYPAAELCNMAASDGWKHRSFLFSCAAQNHLDLVVLNVKLGSTTIWGSTWGSIASLIITLSKEKRKETTTLTHHKMQTANITDKTTNKKKKRNRTREKGIKRKRRSDKTKQNQNKHN